MEPLIFSWLPEKEPSKNPPNSQILPSYVKKTCDTADKFLAEAKGYKNQRYDRSHREPEFKGGVHVMISTQRLNNLEVPNEIQDSFVGPFTFTRLIVKSAVEVIVTEEFSRNL
ncbi:hypothetical protein O181_049599 [Austropuccinia psidii MF-1]|uniref:Uncharacterized protein n=1 Tax=Austropuccinia psidii MF-1 TaxID=1389203 RepID=A0A9Q3DV53_9BASI|nr:hypothetical protein [Austropuccinia psidii MF-1]